MMHTSAAIAIYNQRIRASDMQITLAIAFGRTLVAPDTTQLSGNLHIIVEQRPLLCLMYPVGWFLD